MYYIKKNPIIIFTIIISSIVPMIVWPFGTDYFYLPKIITIYFLLLFAFVFIIILNKKNKLSIKFSYRLVPLLLYIAAIALSAYFSKYRNQAILGSPFRYEGALAIISYFFIMYIAYLSIKNYNDIKIVMNFIFLSASIISLYSIMQYFNIDPIPRDDIRKLWISTSFGTLGNPNFLGSYLSIAFPAVLIAYIWEPKKKCSTLYFVYCSLLYTALLCTKTRSAWIGICISIIILIIFFGKLLKKNMKKIAILIAVFMIITYFVNISQNGMLTTKILTLVDDYKSIVNNTEKKSYAGSERIFIWSRTMEYIFDKPYLGSGPDTFDKVFKMTPNEAVNHFSSTNIYVDKAHNEYLQIIVTTGFPALIFYLWFLSALLKGSLLKINKGESNVYAICLTFGIIAYIIQAFFNISVVSVAPLYWSAIGLLIGVNGIDESVK